MKVVAAAVLALAGLAAAQEEVKSTEEFDAARATGKHVFAKFYAPWCGHCKRLAPVWSDLAKVYEGDEKVKIVKVDCTQQKELCQAQGVRGYPTLKMFKGGSEEGEKYQGRRTIEDFEKFIKEIVAEG